MVCFPCLFQLVVFSLGPTFQRGRRGLHLVTAGTMNKWTASRLLFLFYFAPNRAPNWSLRKACPALSKLYLRGFLKGAHAGHFRRDLRISSVGPLVRWFTEKVKHLVFPEPLFTFLNGK